jgi:uncharacterized YigZ family protein
MTVKTGLYFMYTTIKAHTHSVEIKKSRFIAHAVSIDSPDSAIVVLDNISNPEATHNCWAYKIGNQYRFSDDGEPGGTAGRPILAAIEGQGVDHVLVVVTRFFGGTKLGAGGLSRAYGGTAAQCLRAAARVKVKPKVKITLATPFDTIGAIYPLLEQFDAIKLDEDYVETGVRLTVELNFSESKQFAAALADATRGQAKIHTDSTGPGHGVD